jgi:hypothetical protein
MATPPGPASPGNPISYNDIKGAGNFSPSAPVGIYDFATYIYDDGFINDYTFYPAFYPLPSSPAGGPVSANASISMFYDIDGVAGYDFIFQSGTPGWVSTIDGSIADGTVLASGSNSGPNVAQSIIENGIVYGVVGGSMPHWYQVNLSVTLNLGGGAPPFPAVSIEYNTGGGFTPFGGPPATGPGVYTVGPINNVANGGTLEIRVS